MSRKNRVRLLKVATWILCLIPLGWALYRLLTDDLGADPIKEVEHLTGRAALVVLLSALTVTPARRFTGINDLQKIRRLVGLFAFFYVSLHFSMYIGLDMFFEWEYILEDLTVRPFAYVGFSAFLTLVPLAATSTKASIRRLGKRWIRLHRLVYVAAPLGVIHYFWATKADDRWPTVAAIVLAFLLGVRVWFALQKRRGRGAAGGDPAVAAG